MKILLADDEESIRDGVAHIVKKMNHTFLYAENGAKAVEVFRREKPDLVILDIMMPEINGFDVCSVIREDSNVPVIILSAKGDIVDKTIGFKSGADDYLVKPFSAVELELRINALLRRSLTEPKKAEGLPPVKKIEVGELLIDLGTNRVTKGGETIELTPKEFEIVAFMAFRGGQFFTRDQLIDSIWGNDFVGDSNIVTVFIRKIREKIEDDPAKPKYLLTVWGYGYKFLSND